jgi:AraC-like DNA-binding protein
MEMLQMMLKRYLILCTRLYKQQHHLLAIEASSMDIIREFNYLVENHFKTKHTVAEYADLLNKSPKTLSNLFAKLGSKSPLSFIQDRKMLEAKRMLRYSDKAVKEIAYELGYEDIQTFSRFFKNNEGLSPSEFKEKPLSGKIATPSGNVA